MVKKKAKMENDPQKDQEALLEELVEILVKFQFLCLLVIIFMTELPYINFGSHWIYPSAAGSFFIFSNMAYSIYWTREEILIEVQKKIDLVSRIFSSNPRVSALNSF